MTTFDRLIAPLLARLADVERNETVMSERIKGAVARGTDVDRSAGRLAGQFPDVEVRDPLDRQWQLEPMSLPLLARWSARRKIVGGTECPALAKAAESERAEARDVERRRSALQQRRLAARRSQGEHASVARPGPGWRDLFGRLTQPRTKEQSVTPGLDVDEALRRAAELAETSTRIEQQQTEFKALASDLQRVEQFLDDCDAGVTT